MFIMDDETRKIRTERSKTKEKNRKNKGVLLICKKKYPNIITEFTEKRKQQLSANKCSTRQVPSETSTETQAPPKTQAPPDTSTCSIDFDELLGIRWKTCSLSINCFFRHAVDFLTVDSVFFTL